MTDSIFHITSRISWAEAQETGAYLADSLIREGFIHCSKLDQVMRVANTIFANQSGLVILEIDPSKLKPEVRWEAGTDKADELFPHIYGPLNLEAILGVFDFKPDSDGKFYLPAELK